jgi:plasmid maintenance system antidote protein VapI
MIQSQTRSQLWQYLKDNGVKQQDAACAVGYSLNYVNSLLTGRLPLTPAVQFRFMAAYPETAAFLMPGKEDVK